MGVHRMILYQPKLSQELSRQHSAHVKRRRAMLPQMPITEPRKPPEQRPAYAAYDAYRNKDAPVVTDMGEWVRRQKELWFRIVADLGPVAPTAIYISEIQQATANHFGIEVSDLISRRRTNEIVFPRQVAMYIAKTMTPRSLPEIGRRFGNRDHTTVLHAVNKIKHLLQSDWELADDIDSIKSVLLERR